MMIVMVVIFIMLGKARLPCRTARRPNLCAFMMKYYYRGRRRRRRRRRRSAAMYIEARDIDS